MDREWEALELSAAFSLGLWRVTDETPSPRVVGPSAEASHRDWERSRARDEGSLLDWEVATGDLLGLSPGQGATPAPRPRRQAPPAGPDASSTATPPWEPPSLRTPASREPANITYEGLEGARSVERADRPWTAERRGYDLERPRPTKFETDERAAATLLDGKHHGEYHGAQWRGAQPDVATAGGPNQTRRSEDPYNLGVGPEWRPNNQTKETDFMMVQALGQITSALQNLSAPASLDPEIEFSGRPSEDPGLFWVNLEEWFRRHKTPECRWRPVTRRCLKGKAYKWFVEIQEQEWALVRALFFSTMGFSGD